MKLLWLVMFVTVILGCQEPVPGSCYPNPAGGAGGADSMAVGAGVGATTSGDYAEPPKGPLGAGDGDGDDDPQSGNPCLGRPATYYINCAKHGWSPLECSEACYEAGADCVPLANHPYKSGLEPGKLTYCKNGSPTITCTWTFENGDGCYMIKAIGSPFIWRCIYSGG